MNQLKCPICEQAFDLESKTPIILPKCGHTVCWECLDTKFENSGHFICPDDE